MVLAPPPWRSRSAGWPPAHPCRSPWRKRLQPLLLVAAMVLIAVGSALMVSGWRSRLGAVLLLVFLVPTTLLFHGDVGDSVERIQLLKNLAIVAGLLLLVEQDGKG